MHGKCRVHLARAFTGCRIIERRIHGHGVKTEGKGDKNLGEMLLMFCIADVRYWGTYFEELWSNYHTPLDVLAFMKY